MKPARPSCLEQLEPKAPCVRFIQEIHRGQDAFVTFHRKVGGVWQDLGSVPTARLRTIFPEFATELECDSYFSINSFYRAGHGRARLPGLEPVFRKAEGARYLNACFADIDFHADGEFDFGRQFGQVISAQENGIIPPASLIVRSGRGLWLLWLLIEPGNPLVPPRAFPEKVVAYGAIQAELISRVRADHGASDPARVMRVPGSINSHSDNRVAFWPQLRANGRGFQYTLEELADSLGIQLPELRPQLRRPAGREASERGLRGWRALWQQRFEDFELLRQARGSFAQGCRNRAAYIYGVILRGGGLDDRAVAEAVMRLGRECRPPLSHPEIRAAIEQSKRSRGQIRDSLIAGYLAVTQEEARAIPRWAKRVSLQEATILDMNLTSTKRAELRQQTISDIVADLGRLPSYRQMASLLLERGIVTSYVQVGRDYAHLQLRLSGQISPLFPVTDVTLVEEGGGEEGG